MQTTINVKNEKEIQSTLSKFVFSMFSGKYNNVLHNEVYDKILPQILGGENVTDKEKRTCLLNSLQTLGLDTKIQLAESIGENYRLIAINFANQLIVEYDCQTSSEKALVQIIANSFVRIMEYSNTLETCRGKSVNTNLIGYYSMISKELDRANRHFITNLMALKQIKAPGIKINVVAQNTFIAKNQQFNTNEGKEIL